MNYIDILCDNWMTILLTYPLWGPLVMLVLYAVWVQSERGGIFKLLEVVAIVGYPWDWLLQHTLAPFYFWERTRKGESTVSMRLARLVNDTGWRGVWARRLAWLLNAMAPSGRHI